MGYCDALVSGSFALQFFENVLWEESGLDVEVERGVNFEAMHEWIVSPVGGYTLSPVEKERVSLSTPLVERHWDVAEVSLPPSSSASSPPGMFGVKLIIN